MRVFITGIAGFIGYHVAEALHKEGIPVAGVDNFNNYYDPLLKEMRAKRLHDQGIWVHRRDICDPELTSDIDHFAPTHILHLAAQAGIRYSLVNPQAYVHSNLEGFTHILEYVKKHPNLQLVYASTSSVYGLNSKLPYSIHDETNQQASFYAVTKKSNELMAANYAYVYGIKAIGLRYFTVYGPWGRPDMALFGFTSSILQGKPIDLYNYGNMQRDFTYIDDIVAGTVSALKYSGSGTLFNLGSHSPVTLLRFVEIIEDTLGKKAEKRLLPMQPGEVVATYAGIQESMDELGFMPKVALEEGIGRFVEWYKEYTEENSKIGKFI